VQRPCHRGLIAPDPACCGLSAPPPPIAHRPCLLRVRLLLASRALPRLARGNRRESADRPAARQLHRVLLTAAARSLQRSEPT